MLVRPGKIVLSLVILATFVASITLTFGAFGSGQSNHAMASGGVTATDFNVPISYDPWGTAFDATGRVWVALPGCDPSPTCASNTPPGALAVYNPTSQSWVGKYQLPAGFGQPLFVAVARNGFIWFPMPMSNSLGMFNPSNNTFHQWQVPTAGSGPWGVAVDHLGRIWFTEHYSNKIGYFTLRTHTFTEIATPATDSLPYGITVDASDNIWFTENNSAVALIGEYTASGKLEEYKIRNGSTSGLTPHLITVDHNGNIWWSEGWVAGIGELKVAAAQPGTNNGVSEYFYQPTCSTCGTHTSGIAVDGYGNVWFDDSLQGIFGSFPVSGTGSFSLYNAPTPYGHPHDGLNVDSSNRIWFDEEFAGKIAEAIQMGSVSTPTPSPTMGMTPSPSPSATSTPSPSPTAGTTLAQDNFQRANQTHWGIASDGQAWGAGASNLGSFSINNNVGQIVSSGTNGYTGVLGPSAADAEVVFSGSLTSLGSNTMGTVLRWGNTNNFYKAFINGYSLSIFKKVNGSLTKLQSVAFTAKAGTSYTIRFSVVGTTLSASAWQTGTSEPGNWMVTATDSSLSSGYCGVMMYMAGGVTADVTSFQADAV